jgi:hypothetical protein
MIKEITQKRYLEALEILPPILWTSYGFLQGEAHDHRKCRVTGQTAPTFAAFFTFYRKFFEADPMTMAEFRRFDLDQLPR